MAGGRSHARFWLPALLALFATATSAVTVDPAWLVSVSVTLGGAPSAASIGGVAVDSRGNSVLVGTSRTRRYPGIDSARTTNGGLDLRFVARLDPVGVQRSVAVVGSPGLDVVTRTSERFTGLALDAADNAYVVAFDVAHDVPLGGQYRAALPRPFVYRVSPLGQVTRYPAALDPAIRSVNAIAVDGAGNVVVVGSADAGLVTTPGAAYPASAVGATCVAPYAVRLSPTGATPVYATYLAYAGTLGETCAGDHATSSLEPAAYAVAIDGVGSAFVTGQAEPGARASGGGVNLAPTTPTLRAYGQWAASHVFVTKLDGVGTAVWSARLGGAVRERGTAVLVDGAGNVYVAGKTTSNTSFPAYAVVLFRPYQLYGCALNTPEFGFLAKLAPDGTRIVWSGLLPGDGTSIDDCAGGSGSPAPIALASDGRGGVFAAGFNTSNHVVGMSRNNPMADDGDAFFAQIDGGGSVLYSTWMTLRAPVRGIATDRDGNLRVAGGAFLRQLSPARLPAEVDTRTQPVCAGTAVTLDARVAAAGDVGGVDFLVDGAWAGTAAPHAGVATWSALLAAGVHRVQVRYHGASPFDGAMSPVVHIPVHQAGLC